MKKVLALLCALLLTASTAQADTLTVDLDSATNDELRAARDAIDQCLAQRNLNPETADGEKIWRGDGDLEIGAFSCNAALCRILIYVNSPTTFATTSEGETYETVISQDICEYAKDAVACEGISVKADMPWSLHISPIVEGGTVLDEGAGLFVGNLFTLNQPVYLRLKATWPDQDWMQFGSRDVAISLVGITRLGEMEEMEELQGILQIGDTATQEVTLLPDSRYTRYFWKCDCPTDVQWSIHMQ